jgi:competence protein ComEA
MDPILQSLGVSAAGSAPSLPSQAPALALKPAPVWPRSAQVVTALLLLLTLALLGWHGLSLHIGSTRPTELDFGLDLNQADRAQLRQLPGIGEALASRIDDYRREHGPFRRLEDLRGVRGIGPVALERLRPFVFVEAPALDEDEPPATPAPPPPRQLPAGDLVPVTLPKKPVVLGRIHLNEATVDELRKLPGIGPKLSERILETRKREPFRSVDDLRRVSGIGPKTLERIRPLVTVEGRVDKAVLVQ